MTAKYKAKKVKRARWEEMVPPGRERAFADWLNNQPSSSMPDIVAERCPTCDRPVHVWPDGGQRRPIGVRCSGNPRAAGDAVSGLHADDAGDPWMRGFAAALLSIWRLHHDGQMVRHLISANGFGFGHFRRIGLDDNDVSDIAAAIGQKVTP